MKALHHRHPTVLFVLPVITENLLNTAVGLIFSSLIGGISGSSLTTIALCNQVITVITSAATMLTTGAAILCARLLGEGDRREASRVVEQTVFLALIASAVVAAACFAFASPLMTLLMPGAESDVHAEGVTFFRVLILSLPMVMLTNVFSGTLRSAGDSRSPLMISLISCAFQLLFSVIFLRALHLDIIGAGLTYLLCRACAVMMAAHCMLHSPRFIHRPLRAFRPDGHIFRRILHVGIPASIESVFVQVGYLVANSMVIGLGTFEAAVYNVANTVFAFVTLPQGICSAVATTVIGQLIGSKSYKEAKRKGWGIWLMGIAATLSLGAAVLILRGRLTPIYSADPAVQEKAANVLLLSLLVAIPGLSLNALDPQLRVGGDVKYVMVVSLIAVWLIRLPLTYVFCYCLNWGAAGVFLGNSANLIFRMALNMARFIKGKYLYMRV